MIKIPFNRDLSQRQDVTCAGTNHAIILMLHMCLLVHCVAI